MFKKGDKYHLNVINLGDCRCVISRNNIAIPLTKDHKPSKPEEAKRLRNWVIGVSIALFVLATLPLVLPIVLIYVFVQYMIWELCSQPRQTLQSNVERDYPKGRL